MSEKVNGYILLIIGILLIILGVFSVFSVFTGGLKPYPLFDLPGIYLDLGKLVTESEAPQKPEDLKTELVAKEIINQPLNIIFHIFLMGFIVNAGFKIASLGVQFLRPIKVNLKGGESGGK